MWPKAKNIYLNRPSKKLDQKRYRSFRISKDISQEAFQLELPKEWMIHNVFNKDYKIIRKIETMADIQLQLQNMIKLTEVANTQLVEIEMSIL